MRAVQDTISIRVYTAVPCWPAQCSRPAAAPIGATTAHSLQRVDSGGSFSAIDFNRNLRVSTPEDAVASSNAGGCWGAIVAFKVPGRQRVVCGGVTADKAQPKPRILATDQEELRNIVRQPGVTGINVRRAQCRLAGVIETEEERLLAHQRAMARAHPGTTPGSAAAVFLPPV